MELSDKSEILFRSLCAEAVEWEGSPVLPDLSDEEKGNYSDLKKKGLVYTDIDEGTSWVCFTLIGKKLAYTLGFNI